jgi:U11/U12 small nuclear ribonucleoprotein 20 kDa protein
MGKPYYCEYCDKSFKDELQTRKKHLASVQHQKLRSEHYNKFRDLATFLQEERTKKPCQRNTGPQGCVYGSICRYSHYTREELQYLEQKCESIEAYGGNYHNLFPFQ